MKNKKIVWIFLVLFIIIFVAGYFGIRYVKDKQSNQNQTEITPEEEITDEQYRQTIVSLYFLDKETNQIMPEARLVDIKEIINVPYEKLINLLIEGPKNEKLKSIIPAETKLLKNYMEDDCLILDFSKELLNYNKEAEGEKTIIIKSIVNTVTELTEVNKVKILIDGQTNDQFNETYQRNSK